MKTMIRFRDVRTVLTVAVIAVLACGCAGQSAPSPGAVDQPTVEPAGNQVEAAATVAETAEEASIGAEEVPDYLACDPDALPFALPPDATQCKHVDIITTYFTTMSTEEAIQYLGDDLTEAGWQRTDDGALAGVAYWVKGADQLNVFAGPQEGKTAVQVQEVAAP